MSKTLSAEAFHATHDYNDECSVCAERVAEIRREWELEGDGLLKGRLWLIEDRKALCDLASDAIEDLLWLLGAVKPRNQHSAGQKKR